MEYTGYFNIGYLTKTRGLKGEIQLFFEFEDYEALDLDTIFIEIDAKLVPFFVSNAIIHSNSTAYLKLEDVDHIDPAKILIRKRVFLTNDKLPERDESDFSLADLAGFTVMDTARGALGEIVEVREYPQQYIAVLYYQGKEIMFPLNDDFMEEVNRVEKKLYVNLPEGLIDVYL